MITSESVSNSASLPADKRRTFLYEYIGKEFTLEAIDDVLTNRL